VHLLLILAAETPPTGPEIHSRIGLEAVPAPGVLQTLRRKLSESVGPPKRYSANFIFRRHSSWENDSLHGRPA
jgi:hypothetical protein